MANWKELPSDILKLILNRLPFPNIFISKSVCRSWNSAAQEEIQLSSRTPRYSPWLTLPPYYDDDDDKKKNGSSFFSLENQKVYSIANKRPPADDVKCVGSCHGWLALIDINCVIYLWNPFTPSSPTIQLPAIETLPYIIGVKRKKIGSNSSIIAQYEIWNSYGRMRGTIPPKTLSKCLITKLVFSSAPHTQFKKAEYTVLTIQSEINELAFCKAGDTAWTVLDGKLGAYIDILYSDTDQQFYALNRHACVEAWDLRDSSSPKTTPIDTSLGPEIPPSFHFEGYLCSERTYLVESSGDLLLVIRYIVDQVDENGHPIPDDDDCNIGNNQDDIKDVDDSNNDDDDYYAQDNITYKHTYKTTHFYVYKLDRIQQRWVQVEEGISDRVLFLGINNALTLSALEFPELTSNSIYFTDDSFRPVWEACDYGGHDFGIFNLNDNSITPCYPGHHIKVKPPPVWIVPNPC